MPSVHHRHRSLVFIRYSSIKQVNAALGVASEARIVSDYANGHAVQVKTASAKESDCGCEAATKTA
jgi:hypothetical protein